LWSNLSILLIEYPQQDLPLFTFDFGRFLLALPHLRASLRPPPLLLFAKR
jgi:hypothetical protein